MRHTCNAYCTETEHCDLVYAGARVDEGAIAQLYGWNLGLPVTRAEPAREAPDAAVFRPSDLHPVGTGPTRTETAWLVWWRR